MRFNPDLSELIPAEQLDADFGGNFEYEFEKESYWSQIVRWVISAVTCSFTERDQDTARWLRMVLA